MNTNNENVKKVNFANGLFNPADHMIESFDGKKYLPFSARMFWFRSVYPKGKIETEITKSNQNSVVMNAKVYFDYKDSENQFVSTGHAIGIFDPNDLIFGTKYHELAETLAVVRALKNAGFGVEFGDLDDLEMASLNKLKKDGFIKTNDTKPNKNNFKAVVSSNEAENKELKEKAITEARNKELKEKAITEARNKELKEKAIAETRDRELKEKAIAETRDRELKEKAIAETRDRELKEKAIAEARNKELKEKAIAEAKDRELQEKAIAEAKDKELQERAIAEAKDKERKEVYVVFEEELEEVTNETNTKTETSVKEQVNSVIDEFKNIEPKNTVKTEESQENNLVGFPSSQDSNEELENAYNYVCKSGLFKNNTLRELIKKSSATINFFFSPANTDKEAKKAAEIILKAMA